MPSARVWVTWEKQRRSVELSELFDCDFVLLEANGVFRYPLLSIRTIRRLRQSPLKLLFVQNPSIVLAVLASIYSRMVGVPLVVDRHSNFPEYSSHRAWRGLFGALRTSIFQLLSNFTIRSAHLTIVTNIPLAGLVNSRGGKAFVLPDPIPFRLAGGGGRSLSNSPRVLVVCSYADDEPIAEILGAAKILSDKATFRLTGDPDCNGGRWRQNAPDNVTFTGFLPRDAYESELRNATAILVLSTNENCLLCGCYEALAVGRPLVTSDTGVLREYFYQATHVKAIAWSISAGIVEVLADVTAAETRTRDMATTIEARWQVSFEALQSLLRELEESLSES